MRNVTHPKASRYEKSPPANAATAVFPNSERNRSLGVQPAASGCQQQPKNEVDHNGATPLRSSCRGADNYEQSCVLTILREAYRVAHGERQRIQTDLDLLVGIARALEAYIYDPAYALGRAVDLGLVAWTEIEVTP